MLQKAWLVDERWAYNSSYLSDKELELQNKKFEAENLDFWWIREEPLVPSYPFFRHLSVVDRVMQESYHLDTSATYAN